MPVLNCYSCPGALGACPIGSLQAVLGDRRSGFPFYVLGTLMLFGVVLGRPDGDERQSRRQHPQGGPAYLSPQG